MSQNQNVTFDEGNKTLFDDAVLGQNVQLGYVLNSDK